MAFYTKNYCLNWTTRRTKDQTMQATLTINIPTQIKAKPANWSNYSKLGQNEYHCHLGYSWAT